MYEIWKTTDWHTDRQMKFGIEITPPPPPNYLTLVNHSLFNNKNVYEFAKYDMKAKAESGV